ncbi:methyltransferase domain-containing protein [Goodfellowiella coeruleoviolacea]|uniref:methyltransferase domain-containing protein n=1 Tax=Goodfellowiella coeruleoviolacea TaxID=334858 RepID=UPI0020A3D109|nr:methyltransferase domain-containing protein [Goodfellowiella coeruleoviolacea]
MPAAWRPALAAVRREWFIPDRMWVDLGDGHVAVDRAAEPDRWLRAVRSDRAIITQWDDGATVWPDTGAHATCSASQPSVVAGMLDALDVHEGHRVLEIGTGTGYNSALLAHRLGADGVVSVEVDPVLADQARKRLVAAGHPVRVVTGDGADGWPDAAPFDRVIVTANVMLGQFPDVWIEQTRPGGAVLAPLGTTLTSGPLVRFEVGEDRTAVGRPVPCYVDFMELRAQRRPIAPWPSDDGDGDSGTTRVRPWELFHLDPLWTIALRLPGCHWRHQPPVGDRGRHVLWLLDPQSGSWATASYGRHAGAGPWPVRQHGPRRLWDEAEAAYRWWDDQGRPPVDSWRFTITPDAQAVELG